MLKWSSDWPTRSGHYWFHGKRHGKGKPDTWLVEIYRHLGQLVGRGNEAYWYAEDNHLGVWCPAKRPAPPPGEPLYTIRLSKGSYGGPHAVQPVARRHAYAFPGPRSARDHLDFLIRNKTIESGVVEPVWFKTLNLQQAGEVLWAEYPGTPKIGDFLSSDQFTGNPATLRKEYEAYVRSH